MSSSPCTAITEGCPFLPSSPAGFDRVAVDGGGREAGRSRTPIMALSANVLPGEAEKYTVAGMDDFAGKPTSMSVLAD